VLGKAKVETRPVTRSYFAASGSVRFRVLRTMTASANNKPSRRLVPMSYGVRYQSESRRADHEARRRELTLTCLRLCIAALLDNLVGGGQ
jgi:hypothetical protein